MLHLFQLPERKQQGKIPYVKSSELSDRERKKQRGKWKAASSEYRDRKKMENAVLDLTPPSMENTPPIDIAEKVDPLVVDPVPMNEGFSPPVASTPERVERLDRRSTSEEKRCKRLQKEKGILQKQVVYMRKKLVEVRKLKEKSRKRESRLMARPSQGPR